MIITTCEIKSHVNHDGAYTHILIVHEGKHYFSRLNYNIPNTKHARAQQIQDFLRRQRRV